MKHKVFFAAAVWLFSVLFITFYLLPDLSPQEAQKPVLSFYSSVKGCAENERGTTTKVWEAERGPTLVSCTGEVVYSRAVNHQCCRKVELSKEISDSSISIIETWSGQGCKCMCFSEVEVVLGNLTPGRYMVNVYESGTKPSGEPMEQTTIMSQEVKVK
jgi:hypothetical protein